VVDTVIPPGNAPHWGKLLDINLLVVTGGRERRRKSSGPSSRRRASGWAA